MMDEGKAASGRNIVVCLYGTGNLFTEHNLNVVKLFRVLRRDPAQQVWWSSEFCAGQLLI